MDALEVGGVGVGHAHHVVGRAGEQAALGDFGVLLDLRLERVQRGAPLLVQRHQHEGGAGQAHHFLVQQHHVARDQAALLQQFDAPQAGRGRQVDLLGHVGIGQAPVLLKQAQDGAIAGVQFHSHIIR